jgi:hypothetical protein
LYVLLTIHIFAVEASSTGEGLLWSFRIKARDEAAVGIGESVFLSQIRRP